MASLLRAWDEPTPRTKTEQTRLQLLDKWEETIGQDTPQFMRQEVLFLAGLNDSEWRWVEMHRFVEGTVLQGETYRRYTVKEVRAIRMAVRIKRQNAKRTRKLSARALSNHIHLAVNGFLGRSPIQDQTPLDLAVLAGPDRNEEAPSA